MDNSRYTGEPMRDLILAKSVDFGKRAMDYARLRPGYPDSFHRRVLSLWQQAKAADRSKLAQLDSDGVAAFNDAHFEVKSPALPVADEPRSFKLLDIGCGPGIFGLRFAQLYPKFEVAGVDISDGQIEAANIRAVELGLQTRCSFAVATAEDTKQPDSSVDIAVAAQAWPWFQHDKAMKEIRRVLKPDGIFVIAQNCYLPNRDPVAKDTEDLVLKYNPNWKHAGGDGMYYSQVDQLVIQGGFELIEQFAYDVQFAFTHEGWRGRMRTCNGVGSGTLTDAQVEAWDADLQRLLEQKYPQQPLKVWHRMWGVAVSKL